MTKIPHFPTRLTILKIGMTFKKIKLAAALNVFIMVFIYRFKKTKVGVVLKYNICVLEYTKKKGNETRKKLFDDIIFELILFAKNL